MSHVQLTRVSEIRPERLRWLWRGRLPLGALSLVAGEPGLGKSTFTVEIAARVTRGQLDGEWSGKPRDVAIATAEDHFATVVWGRLTAAGADLDRVHRVSVAGDGELTLPRDVAAIDERCKLQAAQGNPLALVIVDPVGAFIDVATNTHQDAAVRRVLAPLAAMAERQALSVLGVAHLNKGNAERLLNRVGGSVAFGAAPRSVLAFARDPRDPDGEGGQRRVIVAAKGNWGRLAVTCAAHLEECDVPEVGSVSRLVFDGDSDVRAEDLRPGAHEDSEDVDELIAAELANGSRPSADVKTVVSEALGCSRRKVERGATRMRERGELLIHAERFPRRTIWTLIGPDGEPISSHDTPYVSAVSPLDDTALQSQIEGATRTSADSRDSGGATGASRNGHGDPAGVGFVPRDPDEGVR